MSLCAVFNCSNTRHKTRGVKFYTSPMEKQIKFYTFPKDKKLCDAWIKACKRTDTFNAKNARICSTHFASDSFKRSLRYELLGDYPRNYRDLKEDAIPTENLRESPDKSDCQQPRNTRVSKRPRKKLINDAQYHVEPKTEPNIIEYIQTNDEELPISSAIVGHEDSQYHIEPKTEPNVMEYIQSNGNDDENFPSSEDVVHEDTQYQIEPKTEPYVIEYGYIKNNDNEKYHSSKDQQIEVLEREIEALEAETKQKILLEAENIKLRAEVDELKRAKLDLEIAVPNYQAALDSHVHNLLSSIFTPGQIKVILSKKKRVCWSSEDIANAICLRSVSPKAYRYLRTKLNYPFPSLSALKKWALNISTREGILSDIMLLLQSKAKSMTEHDRIVLLSLVDMDISEQVYLEETEERIVGPFRAIQVCFCRGLLSEWKQPVYYNYDTQMTEAILKEIICDLERVGYSVVAVVCNMAASSGSLWKKLKIEPSSASFSNPAEGSRNVYVLADAPHLLNLFRKHYLDQGYIFNDTIVEKSCAQQLLKFSKDLGIIHNINTLHLDLEGSQRHAVKMAAQLVSNTTSKALESAGLNNIIQGNWQETTTLFKQVNDWFDLFNSRSKYGHHSGSNAFGIDITKQIEFLNKVTHTMEALRVQGETSKLPFQIGIQVSNKSLINLYNELNLQFGIEYILTTRLNQDDLEDVFSCAQGIEASKKIPTAFDFQRRLKRFILGKDSSSSLGNNTIICDFSTNMDYSECATAKLLKFVKVVETSEEREEVNLAAMQFPSTYMLHESVDCLSEEALEYLAGYIAFRFHNEYSFLGNPVIKMEDPEVALDWMTYFTKEAIIAPSWVFLKAIRTAENVFNSFHGSGLLPTKMIITDLSKKILHTTNSILTLPLEVIKCYVRTRTYIRIRQINNEMQSKDRAREQTKRLKTH